MKRVATALSACVALLTPAARAQGSTTALRLAYEASPGCPSAPSFRGQVVARTARVRFADGEATDQVLVVSLVQEAGRVVGRLRVDETTGSTLTRELSGASCDEVASALALVAALAFDPQAKIDLALPASPPPPLPLPSPRPAGPAARPTEPRPAKPAPEGPWRLGLGLQGRLASGPLPGFWPQGGLFLDAASTRRGWFAPSMRLAGFLTWRQGYEAGAGRASFSFGGGRVEGCPLRWALLETLEARPCLGLEMAWLQGRGRLDPVERQVNVLWVGLEASGRLRWAPTRAFFLETQGGLGVPLTPYRFVFQQPDTSIHRVSPISGQLAFSLGLVVW